MPFDVLPPLVKELSKLASNALREVLPELPSYAIKMTGLPENNQTKGLSEQRNVVLARQRKLCGIPLHTSQCLPIILVMVVHHYTPLQDSVSGREQQGRQVGQMQ